jgi:hypothetical protein
MERVNKIFNVVIVLIVFSSAAMAQSQNALDNRAVKENYPWTTWGAEAYCDGELVDVLTGSVDVQVIWRFKDGMLQGANVVMKGTGTSTSGEEFKVFEIDKLGTDNVISINWNLIGEEGTHYIVRGTMDLTTWVWISIDKAVCPGRK